MRCAVAVLFVALMFATSAAHAELVDVTVGGSLRIRGNWYSEGDLDFDNDNGPDTFYVEQRTRVNVDAEFTEYTRAFVEFDAYNMWGDGFRGLEHTTVTYGGMPVRGVESSTVFLTGVDSGESGSPVSFYQGYVEFQNIFGW